MWADSETLNLKKSGVAFFRFLIFFVLFMSWDTVFFLFFFFCIFRVFIFSFLTVLAHFCIFLIFSISFRFFVC